MQKIWLYIGIIFVLAVVLAIVEMIREYHTFTVTDYVIDSEKLRGLESEKKIVFLSDLHNRVYGKDNAEVIETIRRIQPDLILIAGDMLVGKSGVPWDAAFAFVKQLPDIAPVYYANGNHEYRMKIYPEKYGTAYAEYKEALVQCGVHFLENASADLQMDGCKMCVSGLEIPKKFYSKLHRQYMGTSDVKDCVGSASKDEYQILLAHNPLHAKAYKEWGADLVLSGHLHGGVVRLPFVGGVISTQLQLFPKYSGEMTKEEDTYIVVSKGLGSHSVNLRLFNLPEIVVLHLNACENL